MPPPAVAYSRISSTFIGNVLWTKYPSCQAKDCPNPTGVVTLHRVAGSNSGGSIALCHTHYASMVYNIVQKMPEDIRATTELNVASDADMLLKEETPQEVALAAKKEA